MAAMGATVAVALVAALANHVDPSPDHNHHRHLSNDGARGVSAARCGRQRQFPTAETIRTIMLSGAMAVPNAIADVPSAAFRSTPSDGNTEVQAVLPDLHDRVIVLTEQFAYSVAWRDVSRLNLTEAAIVVDHEGTIVGHLDAGRLIVSHDLLVGASISLD